MRTVVALLLSLTTLQADDWPQWLGPKRDGVWRESGILDKFPTTGPKKLWSAKVGMGYTGPAISSGRVYLADWKLDEGATLPGNAFARTKTPGTERVFCLDGKTGDLIWEKSYPCAYSISYAAGPRCTPTVDNNRVYSLGAMGDLHCLDAAKGEVIWKKSLVDDFGGQVPVWGYACHPLVEGDKLICIGGGREKLVLALNKTTGETIWASQTCDGDFGYCPPMIYEFNGRRQLIVWHSRAVVGLDPETGRRIWSVPFTAKAALTAPTPRQVGDRLFITSFYNGSMMLKVGRDSAEEVWRSKAKGERPNQTTDLSSIMPTPFIENDHIYGVCSYGELRCLDLDGKRIWSTMVATRGARTPATIMKSEEPAENERWSNAFIIKHEDRFFLFNEQGDLIIAKLSPKGYEELSRAHIVEPLNTMAGRGRKVVWMHPAFADRKVFVRNDAEVICYDLAK